MATKKLILLQHAVELAEELGWKPQYEVRYDYIDELKKGDQIFMIQDRGERNLSFEFRPNVSQENGELLLGRFWTPKFVTWRHRFTGSQRAWADLRARLMGEERIVRIDEDDRDKLGAASLEAG